MSIFLSWILRALVICLTVPVVFLAGCGGGGDDGSGAPSTGTVTYTLTGLTPGQTYYIAATAYDASNVESDFSNEVSGTTGPNGAITVAWDANTQPELAGYKLYYDTAPNSHSNSVDVGALVVK
jgi:hypothetical protein